MNDGEQGEDVYPLYVGRVFDSRVTYSRETKALATWCERVREAREARRAYETDWLALYQLR